MINNENLLIVMNTYWQLNNHGMIQIVNCKIKFLTQIILEQVLEYFENHLRHKLQVRHG